MARLTMFEYLKLRIDECVMRMDDCVHNLNMFKFWANAKWAFEKRLNSLSFEEAGKLTDLRPGIYDPLVYDFGDIEG